MAEKGRGHMAGGNGPCEGQGVRSRLRNGGDVGQERGRAGEARRSSVPGKEFDSVLQAVGEPRKVSEQGNDKTKTSF